MATVEVGTATGDLAVLVGDLLLNPDAGEEAAIEARYRHPSNTAAAVAFVATYLRCEFRERWERDANLTLECAWGQLVQWVIRQVDWEAMARAAIAEDANGSAA
jgi:hypothetical protein